MYEELIRKTKPDKNNNGYGLANIRKTVASNQGNCFIDTSGGVFHIAITIPINCNFTLSRMFLLYPWKELILLTACY